jgi:hypothetical protein
MVQLQATMLPNTRGNANFKLNLENRIVQKCSAVIEMLGK